MRRVGIRDRLVAGSLAAWTAVLALSLTLALACTSDGPGGPGDPLDVETIDALATGQGSGSDSTHVGTWQFSYTLDSCDCPTLTIAGQSQDLCALDVSLLMGEYALDEVGGVLAIDTGDGVLTGAIEEDGSFIVASHHDATTIVGVLESLRRLDGMFVDGDTAEGWAGQRLLGELGGEAIDCRWIGSFVGNRI